MPNELTAYLGAKDPWYKQHVSAAFQNGVQVSPGFRTAVTVPDQIVNDLDMRNVLPIRLLRRLLQDYTRMAAQDLRTCIFECQAWLPVTPGTGMNDVDVESQPDVRIPFVLSAQVGFLTDVQHFRQNNRHLGSASLLDVLK